VASPCRRYSKVPMRTCSSVDGSSKSRCMLGDWVLKWDPPLVWLEANGLKFLA
jgi:hypothetical protein